jgi:CRP-like cAMP-binding protein
MASDKKAVLVENCILAALPEDEKLYLLPKLENITLPHGKVLYRPGDHINYVYFPENILISQLFTNRSGATIEVGVVGREGMICISRILESKKATYLTVVQIPGNAIKVDADELEQALKRCRTLELLLFRYIQAYIIQISQSVACNGFHNVTERLCRWLLLAQDAVKLDSLQLTQEFLSALLGIRQASVSAVVTKLKKEHLISNTRGQITILNRSGLEALTCECYQSIKKAIEQICVKNFY